MKNFICLILLFISQLSVAQTKLELYNSAIGSELLKSLDADHINQINAQIIKNEKLDPGTNYYFLKSIFPAMEELKKEYHNRRVSSILVHNNYLNNWKESYITKKPNAIIFEYLIDYPISELIVSDYKESNIHSSFSTDQKVENIKSYYRLIYIASDYKEYYNDTINYSDLFNSSVDNYIDQLRILVDSLKSEPNTSFKSQVSIKTLTIQSILNQIGNQSKLEALEAVHKNIIIAFESYSSKKVEKVFINAGLKTLSVARLFSFSIGHSYFLSGSTIDKTYDIAHNQIGGPYGVPFKINQSFTPHSFLYAELVFTPFLFSNENSIMKNSYFNFLVSVSNPLLDIKTDDHIDPTTERTVLTTSNFQSIKTRSISSANSKIKLSSYNAFGLNIPIYNFQNLITFEAGFAYGVMITFIESQYDYKVNLVTKYYDSNSQFVYNFNEKTILFDDSEFTQHFNPYLKLRTTTEFPLRAEYLLGLSNSSLNVYLRF